MRRIIPVLLCFCFLVVPVSSQEVCRYAALTFDDGPSGRFTQALLDGLAQRQVQATFLLCGYRIRDYPQIAQRILDEGHEVGNHGYSHKNMQALSRREIAKELEDTQALLPEGTRIRFLRPPGGCCSVGVSQVAEARQLGILSWSVDPRDWDSHDPDAVARYVISHISDGDIILLHDMSDSSVAAAFKIIDELSKQGYRFVTVSQLAELRHTRIIPGKSYCCFPEKAAK